MTDTATEFQVAPVASTGDSDLDHLTCPVCFPDDDLEKMVYICGTAPGPGDYFSEDAPDNPCAVCYSGEIRCNTCGTELTCP
jgi:hypothetical protein